MMKAVIFDLDDTLYVEAEFFRSAFSVVAKELEVRGVGNAKSVYRLLETIHINEGRDRVFNKAAYRLGFPERWVPELVEIHRSHLPSINLAPEVPSVLADLRKRYCLGCITDGIGEVQQRKIVALGVSSLLDSVIITGYLGREHWKPDSLPFRLCCEELGIEPVEAVYVGDNPERDIAGARRVNMISVRIVRPTSWFCDYESCKPEEEPDFYIRDLTELVPILDKYDKASRKVPS